MPLKYKVGDVVRLKSGGPAMTVVCADYGGNEATFCTWFGMNGKSRSRGFPHETLVSASVSRSPNDASTILEENERI